MMINKPDEQMKQFFLKLLLKITS